MSGKLSVKLENRLDEIQRVDAAVEEFSEQVGLPMDVSFQIRLSIEELFTNIVSYGYEDSEIHEVLVTVALEDKRLEICIEDDAKPFNPNEMKKENDESVSLEDMEIGGQGWPIVRNYMDDIQYEYSDRKNKLKLIKNLN